MGGFGQHRFARLIRLAVVLAGVVLLATPATAEEPGVTPLRRTVIALYDGPDDPVTPEAENMIHQTVEMPCNWLGLVVRTKHVKDGPPPAAWLADARAVVTWLQQPYEMPEWVWPWLEKEVPARQLRVVHLEALPGEDADDPKQPRLSKWLEPFGMAWKDGYTDAKARIAVEFVAGDACRLEYDPRRIATHTGPYSTAASNRVWLKTRDREAPDDVRTPVVTGPWGGIALSPWTVIEGSKEGERRWALDPFPFFREALGMQGVPAPDPSVLWGRRLFVFHVDGDGFESISTVDGKSFCGDIFIPDVLEKFRIPCTMSIIVASLTPELAPETPTKRMQIAKAIFALPYVEAASHGTLHPYKWNEPWGPTPEDLAKFGYPRLTGFTYSPASEVRDSIQFIQRYLMPEGDDDVGMLWTGDCVPPPPAIQAADDLGAWNMNGGTFRWDPAYDSVGFVTPWIRRVGGRIQVYAGAANENEFPGFFTDHPAAFGNIAITLERTGGKRILKPANVYAHFYSAERPARLRALQTLIRRWAFEEETLVATASMYAGAVMGALGMTIDRTAAGWRFGNYGACRTVRIDGERRAVDFARSKGIAGAREMKGALFLHLTGDTAEVVLSDRVPGRLHVVESNHVLTDVRLDERSLTFMSEADYVDRRVLVGGLPLGSKATLVVGDARRSLEVGAYGRVLVRLEPGGPDRVEVRLP
ncbi:MAG: hypothetical protein QNJ98_03415 [Planctomycetota bacterium]|nr:hypothetical protein [Planctomycetota bacterium]